jgi:hypothetical protein
VKEDGLVIGLRLKERAVAVGWVAVAKQLEKRMVLLEMLKLQVFSIELERIVKEGLTKLI